MALTREQLKAGPRPTVVPVTIDGFDEPVLVRQLETGEMIDVVEKVQAVGEGNGNLPETLRGRWDDLCELALRVISDEQGEPLLKKSDLPALRRYTPLAIDAICKACMKGAGFDDDVDEAVKN